MVCVPAPACKAMLAEADQRWPNRRRTSDGICGDEAHQRRRSDHNVGNAVDLSHDPAHGVDCNVLAELVKTDPRITYLIWNRRIYNPSISRTWRSYSGSNPHTLHMHVSIKASSRNDQRPWFLGASQEEDDLKPDERKWLAELHEVLVQGKTTKTKGAMWGGVYHHVTQDKPGTLRSFIRTALKKDK